MRGATLALTHTHAPGAASNSGRAGERRRPDQDETG